jgi:hypothetical protein
MPKFPVDAPKRRVVRALQLLGFQMVQEREHIAMLRENPDGTRTPLTLPNHPHIKGSTYAPSAPRQVSHEPTFSALTTRPETALRKVTLSATDFGAPK